jgi:hypothetical protein
MNIYDSLKHAASKDWAIDFVSERSLVRILAPEVCPVCGCDPPEKISRKTVIAEEYWQDDGNGLVTPVTALIRAIREAKNKQCEVEQK